MQPGGIDSCESIPGLLKRLQIPSQVRKKACTLRNAQYWPELCDTALSPSYIEQNDAVISDLFPITLESFFVFAGRRKIRGERTAPEFISIECSYILQNWDTSCKSTACIRHNPCTFLTL